ncbi:unnamed protein product [Staurois parvus]|uniref:Uncharacterized protein n=1 Tax=Staurois parvus TaxID=386267 RepID=A0ABN9C2S9_9NEOB|nr:unnamed protein product [Staurois parvus]
MTYCRTGPVGRTDHLETRALPEGPGVSRGHHEMPLVPFS